MFEFKLPDLGEGVHEAEILKWHVAPGDRIAEDAPLVDVETDKAAVTIPSPRAGLVQSVAGKPGDRVVVGQVIAVIDDGTAAAPSAGAPAPPAPSAAAARAPAPAATLAAAASGAGPAAPPAVAPPAAAASGAGPAAPPTAAPPAAAAARPPAAPATRKLARELGVDLRAAVPTGPGGRVTKEDVHRLAAGGPPAQAPSVTSGAASPAGSAPEPLAPTAALTGPSGIPFYEPEPMPEFERWGEVTREPIRSVRRKVARKMVTSMIVVPHVVHMDEADVTDLEAFRRRQNAAGGGRSRLSLLAFVVKAVVAALKKAPMLNASLDPERMELVFKRYYNIGLAADTPKGLLVPVLKAADRRGVVEVAEEILRLAGAARDGTIALDDLQGGTFTITNIGPLGGIALAPAVNYPEVAILGMGKAVEKPAVRDGQIVIRTMLPLTLSFDHRVADGADAARFVSHVVRLLGDRDQLLLEV